MKLLIERYSKSKKQTIGKGYVLNDDNGILYDFETLELPYKKNRRNISCIPKGKYTAVKRTSEKFGEHFHILGVQNRDYILIHKGNYYTEIRGCILVGSDLKWLNSDNEVDVVDSSKTMRKIVKMLPSKFEVEIIST